MGEALVGERRQMRNVERFKRTARLNGSGDSGLPGLKKTRMGKCFKTSFWLPLTLGRPVGLLDSSPFPARLIKKERSSGFWSLKITVSVCDDNLVYIIPHTIELFTPFRSVQRTHCVFFGLHINCHPRSSGCVTKSYHHQSLHGLEYLADSVIVLGLAVRPVPNPCVVQLTLKQFGR